MLRRPAERDLARLFAYGSDPLVTRFMDWPRHEHIETAAEFLAGCAPRWESGEEYAWIITKPPGDHVLGMIGCCIHDSVATVGFVLHRDSWGEGIATEAARALLEWLMTRPEITRIDATCDAENLASARVLEKLGMVKEGTRTDVPRPNLGSDPRSTHIHAWSRSPAESRVPE